MSWNGKIKTVPAVRSQDIARYISKNSKYDTSIKQAQECLKLYGKFVKEAFTDNNTPKDLEIPINGLGIFHLAKLKGRPDGKKYRLLNYNTGEVVEYTAENEPSTYRLCFRSYRSTISSIKEANTFYENNNDEETDD